MSVLIDNEKRARQLARAIASDIALYNAEAIAAKQDLSPVIKEGRALFDRRVAKEFAPLYEQAINDLVWKRPAPPPAKEPVSGVIRALPLEPPPSATKDEPQWWVASGKPSPSSQKAKPVAEVTPPPAIKPPPPPPPIKPAPPPPPIRPAPPPLPVQPAPPPVIRPDPPPLPIKPTVPPPPRPSLPPVMTLENERRKDIVVLVVVLAALALAVFLFAFLSG